jgi:hypothetical protein
MLENEIIDTKEKINANVLDNVSEYKKDLKRLEDIENFLEKTFEIAFGDGAINKGYSLEEVIEMLKSYSDNSFEANSLLLRQFSSIDDFEKAKKEFFDRIL